MLYIIRVVHNNRDTIHFGPFSKFADAQSAADIMPSQNVIISVEPLFAANRLNSEICEKVDA